MQTLLANGRYKVMEVLYSNPDYDICLCTDVMTSGGENVIVNIYKSRGLIHEYLLVFYEMKKNAPRDFRGVITADGCICAIFAFHGGIKLWDFFSKDAKLEYSDRLEYAHSLLSAALELDLVDDRVAASVLSDENVLADAKAKKINLVYRIDPVFDITAGFRGKRLGRFMRMIFPEDRYLPAEIDELINELSAGMYPDCVAAYSRWLSIQESAAATREQYQKETFVQYLLRRAKHKKKQRSEQ